MVWPDPIQLAPGYTTRPQKLLECRVRSMNCHHTVEMMVLSRATRNMLKKTDISSATVFAVESFCSEGSGLPGSCLISISLDALSAVFVFKSDESLAANLALLALWGLVEHCDAMVNVRLYCFTLTASINGSQMSNRQARELLKQPAMEGVYKEATASWYSRQMRYYSYI